MIRVLVFTGLYASAEHPTRAPFNVNICQALSRSCDVQIMSPQPWWHRTRTPRDWFRAPRDTSTGLEALFPTYWGVPRIGQMWHATGMYLSVRAGVARLARRFPFDVIFAAWAYPDVVAASRLARDFDRPFIANVLGTDMNTLAERWPLRGQIARALRSAHQVFAVSRALGERVVGIGVPGERVVVQHNGVDGARFTIRSASEQRARLDLPPGGPLIVYVGNLVSEKGPDVLIESLPHLARAGSSETRLVMVGGGPLERALRDRAQALGVGGRVTFVGRRPNAEVAEWLAAGDVLCLPSRSEGCPNVVLEALASGRPVVGSAVGGVPELVGNHNGALVAPDAPAALGQALHRVLGRRWDPLELRRSVPALSWDQAVHPLVTSMEVAVRGAASARAATRQWSFTCGH
jgi:glycosyltransferase involved in cell wall biosynthesis